MGRPTFVVRGLRMTPSETTTMRCSRQAVGRTTCDPAVCSDVKIRDGLPAVAIISEIPFSLLSDDLDSDTGSGEHDIHEMNDVAADVIEQLHDGVLAKEIEDVESTSVQWSAGEDPPSMKQNHEGGSSGEVVLHTVHTENLIQG